MGSCLWVVVVHVMLGPVFDLYDIFCIVVVHPLFCRLVLVVCLRFAYFVLCVVYYCVSIVFFVSYFYHLRFIFSVICVFYVSVVYFILWCVWCVFPCGVLFRASCVCIWVCLFVCHCYHIYGFCDFYFPRFFCGFCVLTFVVAFFRVSCVLLSLVARRVYVCVCVCVCALYVLCLYGCVVLCVFCWCPLICVCFVMCMLFSLLFVRFVLIPSFVCLSIVFPFRCTRVMFIVDPHVYPCRCVCVVVRVVGVSVCVVICCLVVLCVCVCVCTSCRVRVRVFCHLFGM